MKSYTITVNGNVYDVTVEEGAASNSQTSSPQISKPVVNVPKATQTVSKTVAEKPVVKEAAVQNQTSSTGKVRVEAGAAGKIFKLEATVGQTVKRGDTIVILEAMKMEIPVVAPVDGIVASVNVVVGDAVEAGALLATLN